MNMEKDKMALYCLSHVEGIGAVKLRHLMESFGNFSDALLYIERIDAAKQDILSERDWNAIRQSRGLWTKWQEEYHSLGHRGIQFITIWDAEYPQRLKLLYDYPMALYVRGCLPKADIPSAAIVGARSCTHYGKEMAEYLGRELSLVGIQIISGLARGIDGAAHRGAVAANKPTYGILGCGVTQCYPSENYGLFEKMVQMGGIISEYPIGSKAESWHFPVRNRIISGFSDVVIIVEAREKSGSLITADLALEQGREIFAVPGRMTDVPSRGCNQLIQSGANILISPQDIIEYFQIKNSKTLNVQEKNGNGLANPQKMVYSCLDLQPRYLDGIVKECGMTVSECVSVLLELELGGYIVETAGHCYAKKM